MFETLRNDWRWIVAVVSGGHFLSHFYKLALPPLFPLLRSEFQLSNAEVGLIMSVTIVGGLLQAPVGELVDRVGAKRVFVAGVGITAGGLGLVGLGPSYPAILALAVITGVGQAAFHPADYALLDEVAEADDQGRAFSVHTFSGYVGSATAPVIVGSLGFLMGWRVALFVVGAIGLLYSIFSIIALVPVYRSTIEASASSRDTKDKNTNDKKEVKEKEGSLLSALRSPSLLFMIGFFVLVSFANKGIQTFTPVLATDTFALSELFGSQLLTSFFAFGAVGVLVGGVLIDRYAPGRVIAVSFVIGSSILFFTVSGIVPFQRSILIVLFGLIGFFISLISPARDQLVSDMSAKGSTGRSFGLVFTGGTVGGLIGPILLGSVADIISIIASFLLIGVFYIVAGGLALSLGRGLLIKAAGTRVSKED